ncbi:PD-(D/E)XK nuclease family protein, partial [Candidatus Aerophobetes bacterium]|nr:PD-(D/E)XK nuclease family protein [Candidatus Aerophobetes bacterium]
AHHFSLDGVNRGGKARIKIHLEMCYRRNSFKSSRDRTLINPSVLHKVSLQTSNEKVIEKLKSAGVPITKAKKGIRVRIASSDLEKAGVMAEYLKKITGGILESKFSLGTLNIQHKPALVIPASNVLRGFYLPVLKGSKVVYDRVVKVKEEMRKETVYDLEVERTHNFVANGVLVHNSIYKFRGAAISNILGFLDTYPDAHQIVLTKNYRSPQPILDCAYRLIQFNNPDRLEFKNKIDKRLVAVKKDTAKVRFFHYDSVLSEAEGVAKLIQEKVTAGEYRWPDFAILVRANDDADPFLRALNMSEIPWRFSGNEGLYTQQEVKLLICFLRALVKLEDSISLYYLAASEIYQMPVRDLTMCMNLASKINRSLFYVFSHLNSLPELNEELSVEGRATVDKILKEIEDYLKKSVKISTGEIVYQFITKTGFLNRLTKNPSLKNEQKIKNIARFFELIQSASRILRDNKAAEFVNYLDLLIQAGDNPAVAEAELEADAVNVLTIHKAKGLEFSVVIMVSLINERFPSRFRHEAIPLPDELIKDILPSGDFHRQEERRLFYVGMTRAQRELYFTSAKDYGGKKTRKPSPFVLEALDLSPAGVPPFKYSALEVIERNAPQKIAEEASWRKISNDDIVTLSHLQIDDYLTCPLKYKYIHVLRVPILRHHAIIYGKALHDAVQGYYRHKIQGKKLSLEEVISCFENSWVNEGFISREHEEKRLEEGKITLIGFYQRAEHEDVIPSYIEEKFNFILNKDRIIGRWDRVDIIEDKVIITDYKSSQVDDKKKADERAKKSLQLAIYALAYYKIFGKIPNSVRLHFLENGLVGEVAPRERGFELTIEKIKQASRGIREGIFDSQPTYIACRYCPYQGICPDEDSKKYIG